jgi:ferredoxin-NADP reductase
MTRPLPSPDEVRAPGPWQSATVLDIHAETASAKTFTLRLADPRPHFPGQHYIVRLTAPDGYRAQRSYSVASAPGGDVVDLTVERLPGGEVSGFLHEAVMPGDTLEVRGPVGYFAWDCKTPVLGVAGGSGVVPLMAMLRAARRDGRAGLVRLVVSVRTPADLYYSRELPGADVSIVYTRQVQVGSSRPAGRLALADLAPTVRDHQVAYVCGSPAFCDSATSLLGDLEVPAAHIRVERFGPSG